MDITNPKKAIKVKEGGKTMIRRAAKKERLTRTNLRRKGASMLIFNYSPFSFP